MRSPPSAAPVSTSLLTLFGLPLGASVGQALPEFAGALDDGHQTARVPLRLRPTGWTPRAPPVSQHDGFEYLLIVYGQVVDAGSGDGAGVRAEIDDPHSRHGETLDLFGYGQHSTRRGLSPEQRT